MARIKGITESEANDEVRHIFDEQKKRHGFGWTPVSDLFNSTNSPYFSCNPIQARFNGVNPPSLASEKGISRRRPECSEMTEQFGAKYAGTAHNCQIGSQKQQCNQKIPFPMIAQGDAERQAGGVVHELARSIRDTICFSISGWVFLTG